MKILQIHNSYQTPGGECSVVKAEKELLEMHGHTVFQFVRDSSEINKYSLIEKSLSFLQIPHNFEVAHSLSNFIKEKKPDVAHVHNVFPLISPSIYPILKRYKLPVIQTIHNFRFLCPNGLFFTQNKICTDCQSLGFLSAVKKKCIRNSRIISLLYAFAIGLAWKFKNLPDNIDYYIALNKFFAQKLIEGGVPEEKIRICGNFLSQNTNELMPKKKYFLYFGRLSNEKGICTLLKALARLDGIKLKIAGTGPIEGELKRFARTHSNLNVEFTGFVSGREKSRLIGEALCTVIPSECYENFPISVIESLSLGTPVIASRIGGLPEIIQHGRTGLLFTPGEEAELSSYIAMLANDEEMVSQMALEALMTAYDRFSPTTHYRRLMEIYNEALACSLEGSVPADCCSEKNLDREETKACLNVSEVRDEKPDSFYDEYFQCSKLYGDDFSPEEIKAWYTDEKQGYFNLGAANKEEYQYGYHEINKAYGFRFLPKRSYDHVLGFGSAYGEELVPILKRSTHITIVEPSEGFCVEELNGVPVKYSQPQPSGVLAIQKGTLDLITCFGVLHHIPNVSTVMNEFYRCLKPDGFALVREPIISMGDWGKPRKGLTKRERGIPLEVFRRIILSAGFQIIYERKCMFSLTSRLKYFLKRPVYNSAFAVWIDRVFCSLPLWSTRYHPTNVFLKLRPTSVFYVLKKPLSKEILFEK